MGLGTVEFLLLSVSICLAVVAHLLARDKGRNVGFWTLLGAIPIANLICILYFIGASNLRAEKKLDDLLELLRNRQKEAT